MTIPPVGSSPVPPSQPDDKQANDPGKDRAESKPAARETTEVRRERVEISAEARRIRERQTEITRLQIAERTAKAIVDDAREIRETASEMAESRRAGQDATEAQRRIDDRLNRLNERKNEARFEDENLLDGREMRFEIDDREETLRTPDASREIDKFEREIRESARGKHKAGDRDDFGSTREFIDRSKDVRTRLEKDVRRMIASAVKESSSSRVKDADHAERLLKEARKTHPKATNQRPDGPDQIEGQAINLLK